MIESFSPKKAALAGGFALLLVLLVGWFLLVSPQRSKAAALDGDINDSRTELTLAQALLNRTGEREADLARFRKAMPSEFPQSAILRELDAASREAGVRLNSVTPQAATPVGSYSTVPIAITIEGGYGNIRRFLGLLNHRTEVVSSKVSGAGHLYSVPQI